MQCHQAFLEQQKKAKLISYDDFVDITRGHTELIAHAKQLSVLVI